MSKKMFALIGGITTGVATIATAVVTYINPEYAAAITASIGVVEGAVVTCAGFFVNEQK